MQETGLETGCQWYRTNVHPGNEDGDRAEDRCAHNIAQARPDIPDVASQGN